MRDRKVILIGGAPTSGKSTIAQSLVEHLHLPWISTDQIRDVMWSVANRRDFPNLFNPEGYTAERFLTEFSAERIAQMEFDQGEDVWLGMKTILEDDYTWKDGFIMEGVSILPHLVSRDFKEDKHVQAIFLVDEDADHIRNVVFTRGLWGDAQTYSDDVKEKEVEWALLFSHKIKAEAEKYGYPLVEVAKGENDVHKVLDALLKQK